jgi:hypothetical protein
MLNSFVAAPKGSDRDKVEGDYQEGVEQFLHCGAFITQHDPSEHHHLTDNYDVLNKTC